MAEGSSGFGVEAERLRQVARHHDDAAADLAALAGAVGTNVGEAHVGRGFGAVAASYRQAFEGFGRNLTDFAEQTGTIAGWLSTMAANYSGSEDDLTRSIKAAGADE